MKLWYVQVLILSVQSCIFYAMDSDGFDKKIMESVERVVKELSQSISLDEDLNDEVLSSVRRIAQKFDKKLNKSYVDKSLLRATFEQKNQAILDCISIKSLQDYLLRLPTQKSKDKTIPWLVNYWYDNSKNIDLIKSLSTESLSECLGKDCATDSDILLVDLISVKGKDEDLLQLERLVKKHAYSVKKMYADNKRSILFSDESITIKNQYLRTLYGIDKIINAVMTQEQKSKIKSVFLDGNKLSFPDTKNIRNLFPNVKEISYFGNPLQYIDESDLDMSAGSRLNFCSTQQLIEIPTTKLSSSRYLRLFFSKKSLSQKQMDSLEGIQYSSDRYYYCVRNGLLETLGATVLFSGATTLLMVVFPLAVASLAGGSVDELSELSKVLFPICIGMSSCFPITYCVRNIVLRDGIPAYSLPYFKHDIVLYE